MRSFGCFLCFSVAAGSFYVALTSAASAQSSTAAVEAGPIWSQADADEEVPGDRKGERRHLERPVANCSSRQNVGLRDSP